MAVIEHKHVLRRLVGLEPYLDQVRSMPDVDLDELIDENIGAAQSHFERELEMCLERTVIKQDPDEGEVEGVDYDLHEPPLDFERHSFRRLPRFRMRRRPIISVDRMVMRFAEHSSIPTFTVPEFWMRIQHNLGIVSIFPVPGAGMVLTQEGFPFLPLLLEGAPWPVIPQLIRVNYTAGYQSPATDPELRDLRRHLAADAAYMTMQDIRDLLPSSVSIDGASQQFDAVMQRLENRRQEIDDFFDEWRAKHLPAKMLVI
ncbi:MAG: hypothetical protein U9R79_06155 [Armatimonadota bacterium]|nr:hypothetical protein [Armatimonadota bacterium]